MTPIILQLEWVAVAAAFVVFCTVPALLAWVDARRARRAVVFDAMAGAPAASLPPVSPVPAATDTDTLGLTRVPPTGTAELPEAGTSLGPPAFATPALPPAGAIEPAPVEPGSAGTVVLATPYAFRLQDLRRVRLVDWPPSSVMLDAAQRQRWEEGQRRVEAEQGRIDTLALLAPFPPQAFCYAGADIGGERTRLRFLLFPGLWPSAGAEAPAVLIVTIDAGDISWTVEAYRPTA